jgi:hypothetical protein
VDVILEAVVRDGLHVVNGAGSLRNFLFLSVSMVSACGGVMGDSFRAGNESEFLTNGRVESGDFGDLTIIGGMYVKIAMCGNGFTSLGKRTVFGCRCAKDGVGGEERETRARGHLSFAG